MSFLEFEAVPPGFSTLEKFIAENFRDSDRSSLSDIRMRKAEELLNSEGKLTPAVLRLRRGLSQKQLAEEIGTSQPAVARLEAGADRPSFAKLTKLKVALDVNYDDLMSALENVPNER